MPENGIEEISFKRTDGGWIFKLRNPFLIGPSSYFLVSNAQKPSIVECLRSNRLIRIAAIIPLILLVVLSVSYLHLPAPSPWLGALIAFFVVYILIGLVGLIERRRLLPLVSGLPRTEEKITLADEFWGSAAHMSLTFLLFLFGIFALNLIMAVFLNRHRTGFDHGLGVLIYGLGTFYWGAILMAKLATRRNAE